MIIKLGLTNKKKLMTFVVATGLPYGMEENIFHYMFKAAWHNASEVQVFGKGGNYVPTIHIMDLAASVIDGRGVGRKCLIVSTV